MFVPLTTSDDVMTPSVWLLTTGSFFILFFNITLEISDWPVKFHENDRTNIKFHHLVKNLSEL